MIAALLVLALGADVQQVRTRNAGDVQAQIVGSDKVTAVPVSTTLPLGTEAGMYVRCVSGCTSVGGAGGTSSVYGVAFPLSGTAAGFTDGVNMRGGYVFDLDTGVGTQHVIGVSLRASGNGGSAEIGTAASPLRTDPTGGTAQPVTGTFWQATQPVSGTITATQGTGSNLHVAVDSAPTTAVTGTFWQTTQPVSGSVTANAGTNLNTSALALDATLTGGTQKAIIRGAAKGATTAADGTTTAEGVDHQALDVQIMSGGIAKDPTAIRALTSADIVTTAPPANASTNLAQVAGATVAIGNGTAAGDIRVSLASDNSAVAGLGAGATGAAVPANAVYQGSREGANIIGVIQCDKSAKADIATATTTAIVAVSGATTIYVCSYMVEIQGVVTTAGTAVIEYGSGTACATSPVAVSPTWTGSTTAGNPTVFAQSAGQGYLFKTIASQGLCLLTTTTTPQRVFVTYAQL